MRTNFVISHILNIFAVENIMYPMNAHFTLCFIVDGYAIIDARSKKYGINPLQDFSIIKEYEDEIEITVPSIIPEGKTKEMK